MTPTAAGFSLNCSESDLTISVRSAQRLAAVVVAAGPVYGNKAAKAITVMDAMRFIGHLLFAFSWRVLQEITAP
jgi:hypothetical protein